MTRDVVTARESTSFKELVRLLLEHRISGVPILDADGALVGIVTESDLLVVEGDEGGYGGILEWIVHPKRMADAQGTGEGPTARDLMTPKVVTVHPEASHHEAAVTMLRAGVKRLPVVDEQDRIVGIVSRADVLQPFMRSDEDIRREVVDDVMVRTLWIDPATVEVEVKDGVLRIEGTVDSRSTRDILLEFLDRVSGIAAIEADVSFETDDRKLDAGPTRAPLRGALRGR